MSLLDLTSLWTAVTARRTKRIPNNHRWGFESERLEDRALLSAVTDFTAGSAAAEVAVNNQKAAASYPNLAGTWNITGTGSTVATGSVVVTSAGDDDFNAVFNINDVPTINVSLERTNSRLQANASALGEDVSLKGKYNKNHDQITLKGKIDVEGEGKVRVRLTIQFNSNTNPTSFTLTASGSNGGSATLQGVRVVEIE